MRLVAHHRTFFDWKLVRATDVTEGDVSLPSVHGDEFRHVQVVYDQPNSTEIHVPDADIERMYAEYEEARAVAAKGYTTKQVGGPNDGATVTVPPRNLPRLSRGELLARHLQGAVFPFHFPMEDLTKIEVVDEPPARAEKASDEQHEKRIGAHKEARAAMAKFLNRRLLPLEEPDQ
jgi:hypothetical protein